MAFARRIAAAVLLLGAFWLLVVAAGVLPRLTPAQRDALALMRVDDPPRGDANAFPTLHFAAYDVPVADLERVAAEEAAAFERHESDTPYVSVADGRYPKLDTPSANDPHLCPRRRGTCLDRVRADPEATRDVLGEHAALLARSATLGRHDHYRYGLASRIDSPVSPLQLQLLPLTQAALRFADGDVDGAYAQACGFARTWRRLRAASDSLIVDLVGASYVAEAARLYAEFLAERDVPAASASVCDAAFAPLADVELDQCRVARAEYRALEATVGRLGAGAGGRALSWPDRVVAPFVRGEHTSALFAVQFAALCGDAQRERIALRAPWPDGADAGTECTSLERLFNPAGCTVADVALPAPGPYYERLLDLDARLRLVGAAQWLRAHPDAAFEDRPLDLRSAHHDARYDPQARTLSVSSLADSIDAAWTIPLGPPPAPPAEPLPPPTDV